MPDSREMRLWVRIDAERPASQGSCWTRTGSARRGESAAEEPEALLGTAD